MDIRTAVAQVLQESSEGIRLLLTPEKLRGSLCDMGVEASGAGKVLCDHCNNEFLRPFYDALVGDAQQPSATLKSASLKVSDLLCNTWGIDKNMAAEVAEGVAAGICDYLGAEWSLGQNPSSGPSGGVGISKGKLIAVVGATVAAVGLLVIVLLNVLNRMRTTGGEGSAGPAGNSTSAIVQNTTEEKVAAVVSDAQAKADANDYESAYRLVADGLKEYPDSKELQTKEAEYRRDREEIENIIDRAEDNASKENFDRALEVIDAGLKTYPNSAKLKNTRASISNRKAEHDKRIEDERTKRESSATERTRQSTDSTIEEGNTSPSEPSYVFPAHWYGSYLGNTLDANGASVPARRKLWFDLQVDDGEVSGTCSVGTDDGASKVDGTFTVTGSYDHQTGSISITGDSWVSQGDLWGMRNFWGTVDLGAGSMSGTCVGTNSGREGDWSVTINN